MEIMKILLQKTKASFRRRKELQSKVSSLLREYEDVPILVAYRLIFKDSKDEVMIDCTKGEIKNQVHIINRNVFMGKKMIYKTK